MNNRNIIITNINDNIFSKLITITCEEESGRKCLEKIRIKDKKKNVNRVLVDFIFMHGCGNKRFVSFLCNDKGKLIPETWTYEKVQTKFEKKANEIIVKVKQFKKTSKISNISKECILKNIYK